MANYYSMGRTNHFAVKDPDAFLAVITPIVEFGDGDIVREERDGVDGFVLCFPDGFPSEIHDRDEDVWDIPMEIDWQGLISEHLADGEVCVIQEIGNEKLRYLTGYAFAFNNKGDGKYIDLDQIYDQSKDLGTRITVAQY